MYHTRTYNSARLPSIVNYAYAKKVFEDAVPYRGRYPIEKPLGRNRRYDHMQIHQRIRSIEVEGDPLGQFATTYACKLYSTDCIEFFPDESIILRVNSWRGPTTMMFLNYTLQEHIGSVQSESGKWYFINKGGEAFPMPTGANEEMHIHFVDGHGFRPKNCEPEYKYKVRRKEMNGLRKYYSDFIEYGKTMLLADGNLGTYQELSEELKGLGFLGNNYIGNMVYENYGESKKISVPEQRAKLMGMVEEAMANNDLEMKYKLMKVIASINCHYRYSSSTQYTDPQKFVMIFDELIKYHHRDSIFEAVEQEIGKPFRDRNEQYFY
jgi:hypothetical protein